MQSVITIPNPRSIKRQIQFAGDGQHLRTCRIERFVAMDQARFRIQFAGERARQHQRMRGGQRFGLHRREQAESGGSLNQIQCVRGGSPHCRA